MSRDVKHIHKQTESPATVRPMARDMYSNRIGRRDTIQLVETIVSSLDLLTAKGTASVFVRDFKSTGCDTQQEDGAEF